MTGISMRWVLIGEIDGPVSMQSGVLQFKQDRGTPRNGGDTCDPGRFRVSYATPLTPRTYLELLQDIIQNVGLWVWLELQCAV